MYIYCKYKMLYKYTNSGIISVLYLYKFLVLCGGACVLPLSTHFLKWQHGCAFLASLFVIHFGIVVVYCMLFAFLFIFCFFLSIKYFVVCLFSFLFVFDSVVTLSI